MRKLRTALAALTLAAATAVAPLASPAHADPDPPPRDLQYVTLGWNQATVISGGTCRATVEYFRILLWPSMLLSLRVTPLPGYTCANASLRMEYIQGNQYKSTYGAPNGQGSWVVAVVNAEVLRTYVTIYPSGGIWSIRPV